MVQITRWTTDRFEAQETCTRRLCVGSLAHVENMIY